MMNRAEGQEKLRLAGSIGPLQNVEMIREHVILAESLVGRDEEKKEEMDLWQVLC
jgi:hypothetical protein